MEAYKVWASLNLKGDILEKLALLKKEIGSTNKEILLLNENLAKVSNHFRIPPELKKLQDSLLKYNGEILKATESSRKLSEVTSNLSVSMAKYDDVLARSISSTSALAEKNLLLAKSLRDVKLASAAASTTSMLGAEAEGLAAGAIVSSRRSKSSLSDEEKEEKSKERLRSRNIKKATHAVGHIAGAPIYAMSAGGIFGPVGIGATIGGFATYSALHHGFEANKEFEQIGLQLSASGATDQQVKEAKALSLNAPKGVSAIEMMRVTGTAFMAARNWEEAKMIAPTLAETELGLRLTYGKQMTQLQAQNLMKYAEFRAGSDSSQIIPNMNLGSKIISAGGFTIKPVDLTNFMKMAGSVASSLTPEAYAKLEPSIQEYGGFKTGTALQTQDMAMTHGSVSSKLQAQLLKKYGFAHTIYDKVGRPLATEWEKKWVKLWETDTPEFVKEMHASFRAQGVPEEDVLAKEKVALKNMPGRLVALIEKNMEKADREAELFKIQLTGKEAYVKGLNMPAGVSEQLAAASNNLALAFGKLSGPTVIGGMQTLTTWLERLTKVLNLFSSINQNQEKLRSSLDSVLAQDPKFKDPAKRRNTTNLLMLGDPAESLNVMASKTNKQKVTGDVYINDNGWKRIGKSVMNWFDENTQPGSTTGISGHNSSISPPSSAMTLAGSP